MRTSAPATRLADALVFLAFLGVPLAVSPALWDQYVSVKWYTLEALAACWLLAEAWAGSGGWPRFLRDHVVLVVLALGLGLASVFRAGVAAALAPLVERTASLALTLCAYWWVRRRGGSLGPARAGTAVALAVVTAIGFAQAAGRDPIAALSAGDGRGATFGNANMAAQYAGLAVLLLLSPPWPRRRWRAAAEAAVVVAAAAWLVLLGTRSVLVALGAAGIALALSARNRARVRVMAAAAACAAVVALAWWGAARLLDADMRLHKAASVEHRLHVWSDTLRLVADHPLGVGAGNFEDAYRPYQATGAAFTDERQVWRQPHNEYLRVAAEEGLPLLVLLAVLLARLAARVVRAWRQPAPPGRPLIAVWAAFLAVEAFFQFPFALAFPAQATALLLGLALWRAEEAPPDAPPPRAAAWRAGAVVAAVLLVAGASRVALSEWLFVASRNDLAAQERACRLDARNLQACVMAAWLRSGTGDVPGGRAMVARVLRRAPHYPPAMKLLAQQAAVAGDHEAACIYMTAYDALFRGQSTLHADLMAVCDEGARRAAAQRIATPDYEGFPFAGADARR